MILHQIQLTYSPIEDRIMMRASFLQPNGELHELRAWLTRRIVKLLWPTLQKAMQTQVALDQPTAAHAKAEMVNMAHQASIMELAAQGKFGKPYDAEATHYPLGETPFLVHDAQFNITRNAPMRIIFAPQTGSGFEISFTPQILHGFSSLMPKAVANAEWDMELYVPSEIEYEEDVPRVLN